MRDRLPPLTTRRFFQACLNNLGMAHLQKLYKKSPSEIYRWAADPRTNGETRQNPLDRIQRLFEDLYERGYSDIVLAALRILAGPFEYEVIPKVEVTPDAASIEAECLQDYPRLVSFHEAICGNQPYANVQFFAGEAIREIRESLELYRQGVKP